MPAAKAKSAVIHGVIFADAQAAEMMANMSPVSPEILIFMVVCGITVGLSLG